MEAIKDFWFWMFLVMFFQTFWQYRSMKEYRKIITEYDTVLTESMKLLDDQVAKNEEFRQSYMNQK